MYPSVAIGFLLLICATKGCVFCRTFSPIIVFPVLIFCGSENFKCRTEILPSMIAATRLALKLAKLNNRELVMLAAGVLMILKKEALMDDAKIDEMIAIVQREAKAHP